MSVAFAPPEHPTCSIVILAWRTTTELIECLESLTRLVDAPPFEIVLVLNGADDAVREVVATEVRGATIVDLPANVGFGGGCNAGAAAARGEYLVFLNDDTVVDADWLRVLHSAAVATEAVGAVASLLLNPSGTVQESGSRVLSTADTIQLGHGSTLDEAAELGLLERRPVDYGSAAALLVPTPAFQAAAGFDPAYEPAYCEDVDLQFRLRAAGLAVVVEPGARVTHLSGASTAGDNTFRVWSFSHSVEFFRERWATALASAPEKDAPVDALCDVAVDDARVSFGRAAPSLDEIRDSAETTARSVAAGFTRWVTSHYEYEAGEHARLAALLQNTEQQRTTQIRELSGHLAAHVNRVAELADRVDVLETEAVHLHNENDLLHHRLDDLDSRGPLGIVRWQAGLVVNRRRSGRS